MHNKQPNLFQYTDYRRFLRDLYAFRKDAEKSFSFRKFSLAAGFSSPNYLKLVMDGARNLTQKSIDKFVVGLKLNKEQAQFFTHLVYYTQADALDEKNRYFEKMSKSRGYVKFHALEKESFDYLSHWYNVAIREMSALKHFRSNVAWIANQLNPPINMAEAKKALDTLERLGFVSRNAEGTIRSAQGNLSTSREVGSLAAANYHRQMIKKGLEAIETTPAKNRDISALTVAIRRERIAEVKEMVQNFRRQLHALLADDGNPDAVYQVNIQMFPLTRVDDDEEK